MLKTTLCILGSILATVASHGATLVDFEDKPLASSTYYNGADLATGFHSRGAYFNNTFTDFGGGFTAWAGWSYSNIVNSSTPGFGNQYASYPGGGSDANGTAVPGGNYAIAYGGSPAAFINLPGGQYAQSVRLTNTTYAALSMANGDSFAKKFGGATGNDPDFFKVTLTGYVNPGGAGATTGSVDFYLADFRFPDQGQDYIVNNWRLVDLTPLGNAASIGFSFGSSDVGQFGINTPTYVGVDNLQLVPEPGVAGLLALAALFVRRRAR